MVSSEVARAVEQAHEQEWANVLATTARVAADLDLAEDCVQDAYAKALVHWSEQGVPRRPGAWLTTVATRRALEHRRRAEVSQRKLPLLIPEPGTPDAFPDDRLRLVFTCCHPALAQEARIALTLRLVCGLSSAEIAKAFLVKETAMQARITRAKHKISQTRIPYRIPRLGELPERIDGVLDVIHLVYSAGHTARFGDQLIRYDLTRRGLDLARMVHLLLPDSGEATALLGLLLLTHAREPARVSDGALVLLPEQDRSLWDQGLIAEGLALVQSALQRPPISRFSLMAAVAAVHSEADAWEETDWQEILGLYDLLLTRWPSPVVALNRAVALSYTDGPAAALAVLDSLSDEPALATYPYYASTRADLLRRTGHLPEAAAAYEEALAFTDNTTEAAFLTARIDELRS
jgi:RNA polymerase sigma-70 factor (ECF subfamily)